MWELSEVMVGWYKIPLPVGVKCSCLAGMPWAVIENVVEQMVGHMGNRVLAWGCLYGVDQCGLM
jgi:hypothetical protein